MTLIPQARKRRVAALAVAGTVVAVGIGYLLLARSGGHAPSTASATNEPVSRLVRVSSDQYRQNIADVFGPTIVFREALILGNARVGGLLAVGAAQVSYSAAGFHSAHDLAADIAQQVTNSANRGTLIPCHPADEKQPDDACAQKFFAATGRLLWRRALSAQELATQVRAAHAAAQKLGDFYRGLAESLAGMLVSPNFLFRIEQAQPVPGHAGVYVLTAYSKAARLASFLWNSSPDNALLAAAESGQLDSAKGLSRQVDDMLASPKVEHGVRAFFSDLLAFEKFDSLDKSPSIYPRYTGEAGKDMQESMLRVLVNELLVKKVPYEQLFNTRTLYLTPALAALLDVKLPPNPLTSNGAPGLEWTRYELAPNDPRAGLLAMPAFTALNAHPGKSSPTLRGKAIREQLLCQKIPDPPAAVDFSLFNSAQAGATARDRLTVHRTNATCAGCHALMDPLGLSLENFDGSGAWRTTESGQTIDASGTFNGVSYTTAAGLEASIGGSQVAVSCLVNRLYSFGTARTTTASDRTFLNQLKQQFDSHGRQYPQLLRLLATAPEFYTVSPSEGTEARPDRKLQASVTARSSPFP